MFFLAQLTGFLSVFKDVTYLSAALSSFDEMPQHSIVFTKNSRK